VDQDRRAIEVEFEWASGAINSWSEEGPRHHPDEIFGALTILEEEDPTGADPVDALRAWCDDQTAKFRQDWTSEWEPLKSALAARGLEPDRCFLVEHVWYSGGRKETAILTPDDTYWWFAGSGLEPIDETALLEAKNIKENRILGARACRIHEHTHGARLDVAGPDRRGVRDGVLGHLDVTRHAVCERMPHVEGTLKTERRGDALHVTLWFRFGTTPRSRKGVVWIHFSWGPANRFYRNTGPDAGWVEHPYPESASDGLDLVISSSVEGWPQDLEAMGPVLLPADRSSRSYAAAVEGYLDAIPGYLHAHRDLVVQELERFSSG